MYYRLNIFLIIIIVVDAVVVIIIMVVAIVIVFFNKLFNTMDLALACSSLKWLPVISELLTSDSLAEALT